MQVRRWLFAVVCGLVFVPCSAHAQQSALAGTWVFEQEVRTGPDAPPQRAEAVLQLEQRGDSLVGTWTLQVPGRTPRPIELRGRPDGARVVLHAPPQQGMMQGPDGSQLTIETLVQYELRVDGDAVRGTIHRSTVDGSVEIPPTSINGRRRS